MLRIAPRTFERLPGRGLRARLRLARALRRERAALRSLDADALCDIGVTPDEARAEARRPVWDAPERWHR